MTVGRLLAQDAVVILLCGGDKGSQARDIERAQDYWRDYRSRSHE